MSDDRIICVILTKGRSTRIPRKNVMPFLGKPLIVHSILAAKAVIVKAINSAVNTRFEKVNWYVTGNSNKLFFEELNK